MTLKLTGTGRVTTYAHVPIGGVRASLHNFDIDGATPKREHLDFLRLSVMPILVGKDARIWLQGSASRSGSASRNLILSKQRADAVVAVLRAKGVREKQINADAVGAKMTAHHPSESESDRAVSLLAAPLLPLPPPSPPARAPTPKASKFRIKLHAALGAGAGGGSAEYLIFQIWDYEHGLTSFYHYGGVGAGKSAGPFASATLVGPWNDFSTTASLQVNQFEGPARFTTAGMAWWTNNHINMMGLPSHTATIPASLPINTGFTIGLGASTTVGRLIIVDKAPWPLPEQ